MDRQRWFTDQTFSCVLPCFAGLFSKRLNRSFLGQCAPILEVQNSSCNNRWIPVIYVSQQLILFLLQSFSDKREMHIRRYKTINCKYKKLDNSFWLCPLLKKSHKTGSLRALRTKKSEDRFLLFRQWVGLGVSLNSRRLQHDHPREMTQRTL